MSLTQKQKCDIVEKEKLEARKILNSPEKFEIKRDVFFVPGWTDEDAICWQIPYKEKNNRVPNWIYTIKDAIGKKILNVEYIHIVKFMENPEDTTEEAYNFTNFFQFAEFLKKYINKNRKSKLPPDIIGHSMGGLDAATAIALDPSLNKTSTKVTSALHPVNRLITVSTPFGGGAFASLSETALAKIRYRNHPAHRKQMGALSNRSIYLTNLNDSKVISNLFNRTKYIDCFCGTDDLVVLGNSYQIRQRNISQEEYLKKVTVHRKLLYAAHSQKMGITQDPRMILQILQYLHRP